MNDNLAAASSIWSVVPQIGTPIALAAFAMAVAGWIWHARLKQRQRMVESAPAEDRARLVETILSDYRIQHDNLTREQKFQLVSAQLRARETRTRYGFMLAALVSFFVSALVVTGMLSEPSDQERPSDKPQGSISSFLVKKSSVVAKVANRGRVAFAVNDGHLSATCRDEPEVVLPLEGRPGANGSGTQVASNREVTLEFDARYRRFPLAVPQASQCKYKLTLRMATGHFEANLNAERDVAAAAGEQVTLFKFQGDERPFRDFARAFIQASSSASRAIEEPGQHHGVEVLEIAGVDGDAPQSEADLHEILRLSQSLLVASGAVTGGPGATRVRAALFMRDLDASLRKELSEVAIPFEPENSFELARNLNEIAIYYALAKSVQRRGGKKTTVVAYLRLADNIARSLLLSGNAVPAELQGLVRAWANALNRCLEHSVRPEAVGCA